jgi:hypothetical protein
VVGITLNTAVVPAEHEQQQHQRAGQANDLGLLVVGGLPDLTGAAAVGDLEPSLGGGLDRGIELVEVAGVQPVGIDAPGDVAVSDRAVLGHRSRPRLRERADRLDDVGQFRDVAGRLVNRRLLIGDRATDGVEHDLPAIPALLGERAVQHAQSVPGVAARHVVVVDVFSAEGALGAEQGTEDNQPADDDHPVPLRGEPGEPF